MTEKKCIYKKISAFFIMFVMIIQMTPFNLLTIFANQQKYVGNVTIRNVPNSSNVMYSFSIGWRNPQWSTVMDTDAVESDQVVHTPEAFRVEGRNATARDTVFDGSVIGKQFSDDYLKTENQEASVEMTAALTNGSIYEYRVVPYHYHTYQNRDLTIETKPAPYDNSTTLESVLYMTDLTVSAKGAGNTLTVTWDNPQFDGANVFSGYRIYYQRGGSSVTNLNEGRRRDVSIDNEDIIVSADPLRKGVQRIEYSITDDSLAQGDTYAVKVEPLYNGVEIRDFSKTGLSYADVNISNKMYKMAFTDYRTKEYRTNDAYVSIPLEVNENGRDYLKLHWWGISNSSTSGDIERIEIYKGIAADDIGVRIGTLYSSNAVDINYWQVDKPESTTYYQLKIYLKGMNVPLESEVAVYDPSAVNITPNRPNIYIKTYKNEGTRALDVYWDVFLRYPYSESELGFVDENGMYNDKNIEYDLWISDSLEALQSGLMNPMYEDVTPASLSQTNIEESENPVYYKQFDKYTSVGENAYVDKNIEENKVYYIKLVATKPVTGGKDLSTQPVYALIYYPASGDISNPRAINKPPLEIKKDENGADVITDSSITVQWKTKWFEIYDNATDTWYSEAYVNDLGEIIFDKDNAPSDSAVEFHSAASAAAVKGLLEAAGVSSEALNLVAVREVDLTAEDIKYEINYVTFDGINENGGYESYLEKIMASESSDWKEITPVKSSEFTCEYNLTGLEKNTTYAIILRPYRILADNKKDAYPTYVIGTTLPESVSVDITPTVPTLEEEGHTDIDISVKWKGYIEGDKKSLDYELAISDYPLDDPSKGRLVSSQEIIDNGLQKYEGKNDEQNEDENGEAYVHYKIDNLVPSTGYYIWIRAIAHNQSGDAYSSWSNPLYIVTDALGKPLPPDGLGLISQEHLNLFNNANSTEYKQREDKYLILEWFKNEGDNANPSGTSGDKYDVLTSDKILENYIIKMNDLEVNTKYYARVKATVVAKAGSDGKLEKSFFYTLQFADNEDFKDAITIIVPEDLSQDLTGVYVAESDWSSIVIAGTGKSDSEYDGDKNPALYPLPKDDFEVYYDGATKTLTYRFRAMDEDKDKLDDNFVDQRLISKLIARKTYNYDIDLTKYNEYNYEIRERIVEMPYTVVEAFGKNKITFEVRADNITYVFDPDFAKTQQVEEMRGYGLGAKVKIKITSGPTDVPIMGYGESYSTKPQRLSVSVVSDYTTTVLNELAENVKVKLKLDDRYSLLDTNVGAYMYTPTDSQWNRVDYVYDYANGDFSFSTKRLGAYSAIKKQVPNVSSTGEVVNSLVSVTTKLHFTDIQQYNPQAAVSTVQFNNIIAAVANGKKDVAVNGALDNENYTALSRKGMVLSSANVSREEGITALVKLYEAKTGRPVEYYTSIENTEYTDIRNASEQYRTWLLKAGQIGFFKNTYGARPKDTMSFADLLYIVDIIMKDSGM